MNTQPITEAELETIFAAFLPAVAAEPVRPLSDAEALAISVFCPGLLDTVK